MTNEAAREAAQRMVDAMREIDEPDMPLYDAQELTDVGIDGRVDLVALLAPLLAEAWEAGWWACEEAHDGSTVSANPKYHVNPYAVEADHG